MEHTCDVTEVGWVFHISSKIPACQAAARNASYEFGCHSHSTFISSPRLERLGRNLARLVMHMFMYPTCQAYPNAMLSVGEESNQTHPPRHGHFQSAIGQRQPHHRADICSIRDFARAAPVALSAQTAAPTLLGTGTGTGTLHTANAGTGTRDEPPLGVTSSTGTGHWTMNMNGIKNHRFLSSVKSGRDRTAAELP